ncbi:MAG: hypothetical protein MUF14_03050 [Hyphomonadaceae bacterium]|jgi:hypothetical protein|nr:hypothetical protein [Hyphomonadaceae bacterium]
MIRAPSRRVWLGLVALGLVAGCGFQPVYSASGVGIGQVSVPEIEGRTGYFVRNELLRLSLLEQRAPEVPVLTVRLTSTFRDASTRTDSFSDRTLLNVTAAWRLETSGEPLTGLVTVDTGFDSRDAAYGGVILQADAEERLAGAIARAVWADLRAKRSAR